MKVERVTPLTRINPNSEESAAKLARIRKDKGTATGRTTATFNSSL